jgi:hypothetical protein
MNAVFQCPRCNSPLGTPDDPKPEPLPPCPPCGWTRAARRSLQLDVGLWLTAGLFLALGLGAGWLTAHAKVAVLFALILFGPVATAGIARGFPEGWLLLNGVYAGGLMAGLTFWPDGETFSPGNLRFPLAFGVSSLLLGWFVGWLKHSD